MKELLLILALGLWLYRRWQNMSQDGGEFWRPSAWRSLLAQEDGARAQDSTAQDGSATTKADPPATAAPAQPPTRAERPVTPVTVQPHAPVAPVAAAPPTSTTALPVPPSTPVARLPQAGAGIVWQTVLGPPRALHPWRPRRP